ncbi:hypothetical protein [Pedobacter sp. ASV28]|uniref:hypothetical protein n=1 Tax=Pedobacter sp. ASV28 TaxID=2795123 RepID=UPI0018EAF592|nr:hypothetical protein [Pedobacter sp. ASV28]
MKKHLLRNLIILGLLVALGMIHGAQVVVKYAKQTVQMAINDTEDSGTESSEEPSTEISHQLYLHEQPCYVLYGSTLVLAKLPMQANVKLPIAYLQLKTPPPDRV